MKYFGLYLKRPETLITTYYIKSSYKKQLNNCFLFVLSPIYRYNKSVVGEEMLKKIEGIVIREMDYKEASKIITILTPNNEKLGILVRGARKIKSKLSFTNSTFYSW